MKPFVFCEKPIDIVELCTGTWLFVQERPPSPPKVFSWGNGRNGRLGVGDTRDRPSACQVEAIRGVIIEGVFCGVSHSMAVCSTGACYAWGKNNSGQCGETDPSGPDIVSAWATRVAGEIRIFEFVISVTKPSAGG